MCNDYVPGSVPGIIFRLQDGAQTLYHSTGIMARPEDAKRDQKLRSELDRHCLAMCKAYTLMQLRRMDMTCRIFENEISRVLSDACRFQMKQKQEPIYPRLLRYIDEAHRDGVMGDGRYAVALGKAAKLQRFLTIIGRTALTAREFTADMLLEFRQFIYDEYEYVARYPELYPRQSGHRPPRKRLRDATVVHDLKRLLELGISFPGQTFDVMLAGYLINPQRRSFSLTALCAEATIPLSEDTPAPTMLALYASQRAAHLPPDHSARRRRGGKKERLDRDRRG